MTATFSDWRIAELLEWQQEERLDLPYPADLIVWLENHGYYVDLCSGNVERLEPLQAYLGECVEDDTFLDVMEYHEEIDWNRRGGWL